MTKTNTAPTGPVHELPVTGCQLKKVRRRSPRFFSYTTEDDASTNLTAIQGEALSTSPTPSAADFASTQHPQQNVHQAMLIPTSQHTAQTWSDESVVPVAGGRSKDYCEWWREQVVEQSNLSLFNVRLIGDASNPQLFTPMAHNDLAYCSKWGHNRVLEHKATAGHVILLLPVLTKPEIVEQSVAGVLSGQISLSMSNVEAILVLANAVGFVSLETACTDYLCVQAQQMTDQALLSLAKLADHLGVSSLLETAAEALIKLPWEKDTWCLKRLLQMSLYKRDPDRRDKLLHHPQRGAYTELQLLELLKRSDTPSSDCASAFDVESLQPSELHALLAVFADKKRPNFEALLHSALRQHMVPEVLRSKVDWTKPVRIIHNIMLPEQQGSNSSKQIILLPKCDLELHITPEHKEGQEMVGLYLYPPSNTQKTLEDRLHQFTVFSVHTRAPFLRSFKTVSHGQIKEFKLAAGVGWQNFFGDVRKYYPGNYPGPFIIGVCWQDASDADSK